MTVFQIVGRFNSGLLCEELVAAFPELIVLDGDQQTAVFTLVYDGTTLTFKSRPTLNESTLRSVLTSHNPNGKSSTELAEERRKQLKPGILDKLRGLGFTDHEIEALLSVLQDAAARKP